MQRSRELSKASAGRTVVMLAQERRQRIPDAFQWMFLAFPLFIVVLNQVRLGSDFCVSGEIAICGLIHIGVNLSEDIVWLCFVGQPPVVCNFCDVACDER